MIDSVSSSDSVTVAVVDLGGSADSRPLLISHATGFHGRCYRALAAPLSARWHVVGFDYRAHGATPAPAGWNNFADGPIDWERAADDAIAVAEYVVDEHGRPLDAFGHSMGGACLLIAAARRPELFRAIVVLEPIVPAPVEGALHENLMVGGALRRRATFPSFDAAIEHFAAKPPLGAFRPDALGDYVRFGFRACDDGVTLCCTPDAEAATFAGGSVHRGWDLLPNVTCPVVVLAGRDDGTPPPKMAEPVAGRLARGAFRRFDHVDHFAPMTHPDEMAAMIDTELNAI